MIINVTYDMLIEREPYLFVAEASDIGIPPGGWPTLMDTEVGNGCPLVLQELKYNGQVAVYHQMCGCMQVSVFND